MLQPEDLVSAGLTVIPENDQRLLPPDELTPAPVDPQLQLLPTDLMHWTQFERLLLRVAREVRGLRSVSLYGNSGQSQEGLDVIGLDGAGTAEGIQSKKYKKFTKADLDAAIKKFDDGALTFEVPKLVIGVACSGHESKVVEQLIKVNQDRHDLEVELWDQERLSEMLRDRPDIVREFFGVSTAASFCVSHVVGPVVVPAPAAIDLAGAVLAGPLLGTSAAVQIAAADEQEPHSPQEALDSVRAAQEALTSAGFPAHAYTLDERLAALHVRLNQPALAARLLLDRVWAQLAADRPDDATTTLRTLDGLLQQRSEELQQADGDEGDEDFDDGKVDDQNGSASSREKAGASAEEPVADLSPFVAAAVELAQHAVAIYTDPLGRTAPDLSRERTPEAAVDEARLTLLAGEVAFAAGATDLQAETFLAAAQDVPAGESELAIRLRLLAADLDGAWQDLKREARTRVHGRELSALILARFARSQALRGNYDEADENWAEAIEQACLVGRHEDAASWLYSRRTLAMRYRLFTEDVYHPLASSLNSMPNLPRLVSGSRRTRERALDALHRDQLRRAIARLRRYLTDAVVSGSWQEEGDARELLADCYKRSNEYDLAAHHHILAGHKKQLEDLATTVGDHLLPWEGHLAAQQYWVQASAMAAAAAQADLATDEQVAVLIELGLATLEEGAAGTLVDTPLFGPSKYLAAHHLLASLMDRADHDQANRYLDLVEDRAPREPHTYFHTDDDHAKSLAEIAATHPDLAPRAADQLLAMLKGQTRAAEKYGSDFLLENIDAYDVRAKLEDLSAQGITSAKEMLAAVTKPEEATADDLEAAETAAASLLALPASREGFYTRGTGAVRQSVLARFLSAERRAEIVRTQIGYAQLLHEGAANRNEYLLAASNLVDGLPEVEAGRLFNDAMNAALEPAASAADAVTAQFSHPLGAFRITGRQDSRPAAVFLSACLARTEDQQSKVRDAALMLVGADESADYRIALALQRLNANLDDSMSYLAKFGWSLRSVAAIAWARSSTAPAHLGRVLAQDPDPRVRRALGREIARLGRTNHTDVVREMLAGDPRHSVRSTLALSDKNVREG